MNLSKTYPILKTKLGVVTTPYGGKTKYEKFHQGIDIANKNGTPIPAFEGGQVIGLKQGQVNGDNGFGNSIIIKDKYGKVHRYSHLKDILVKPLENIPKNKVIGTMGDTGSSYSPGGGDSSHLDYRIHDAYKKHIDPTKYVK